MVFLIQNTQNRDGAAVQLKLDELIHAVKGAQNWGDESGGHERGGVGTVEGAVLPVGGTGPGKSEAGKPEKRGSPSP